MRWRVVFPLSFFASAIVAVCVLIIFSSSPTLFQHNNHLLKSNASAAPIVVAPDDGDLPPPPIDAETPKPTSLLLGLQSTQECTASLLQSLDNGVLAPDPAHRRLLEAQNISSSREFRNLLIPLLLNRATGSVAATESLLNATLIERDRLVPRSAELVEGAGVQSVLEKPVELEWMTKTKILHIKSSDLKKISAIQDEAAKSVCVDFVEPDIIQQVPSNVDPALRLEEQRTARRSLPLLRFFDFLFEPPSTVTTDETPLSEGSGAPMQMPNDPSFPQQRHLQQVEAPAAWSSWTGPPPSSQDGLVAVLDTGCDLNHPDLKKRFWKNEFEICQNGIDDDFNGFIDDCYGYDFAGDGSSLTETLEHGSAVIGAVTADTNNSFGIAGTCWSCKVICCRVGIQTFSTVAFTHATNYAVGLGVKVINYSGNGPYSRGQEKAIRSAGLADVLVVTCAGNDRCDLDGENPCTRSTYPAKLKLSNLLVVGATELTVEKKASYSNYGISSVDIFAPSGLLLPMASSFKTSHGTSFSAPLVAGAAILIRSRYPELTAEETIVSILKGATKKVSLKNLCKSGGVLNLHSAMREASYFLKNKIS